MSIPSSRRPDLRRLARYGATGLANTAVGYAVILVGLVSGLGDILANGLGYFAGFVLSFFLHKHWTYAGRTGQQRYLKSSYLMVVLIAYGANLAVVLCAQKAFGLDRNPLVHLAAIGTYTIISYVGLTYFVFAAPKSARPGR